MAAHSGLCIWSVLFGVMTTITVVLLAYSADLYYDLKELKKDYRTLANKALTIYQSVMPMRYGANN